MTFPGMWFWGFLCALFSFKVQLSLCSLNPGGRSGLVFAALVRCTLSLSAAIVEFKTRLGVLSPGFFNKMKLGRLT